MRKYGIWAALIFLFVLFPGIGHAESVNTHISLDGNEIAISSDAQVQIVNGNVMVPLRLVAEQLGYKVKWDNVSKTATIEQDGNLLRLILNNEIAEASGRQVKLDTPPFLSGNITFVPLRFVGEETGTTVGWDNLTKTVYLTTPIKTTENALTAGTGTNIDTKSTITTLTDLSFSENKLQIQINGTVNPNVFTMTNKDRIVIDLPNTSFSPSFLQSQAVENSQNGTLKVADNPDVSNIRYSLFSNSPSTVRIVLDLNIAKNYSVINVNDGRLVIDLSGTSNTSPQTHISPTPTPTPTPIPTVTPTATPTVTPTPLPTAAGTKLVVIDAGHGGKDPGGISLSKYNEKDFTLSTVLKIKKLLEMEPMIKVVLTRSDDSYPTLQERAKVANDLKADLFVSIHANSIPAGSKSSPSGTETYYTRQESLEFAKTVHKYLIPATGLSDRGVRQSSLYVTRETKMPAILLECGYLSSANDEALLYSEDFQQRVAEAVVSGIKEYLGL